MSIFGALWSGVKSVGKGIWNALSGENSGSIWQSIAGLGSAATNYVSSSKGLKDQYKYNTALQQQAQQWSTGMASTAHQLEVKDLRKAGLNPILSATGGSGASAPGASGGSVGLPDYNLGEGISTALQFRQQKNLNDQSKATVHNIEADSLLKGAQEQTESERFASQIATTKLINKQIEDIANQIKNRNATTAGILKRYQTMNLADLLNAKSNQVSSTAAAHRSNVEAIGIDYDNKKRANDARYYGSGIGKRTQMAKEFVKNIPFIGKFAY